MCRTEALHRNLVEKRPSSQAALLRGRGELLQSSTHFQARLPKVSPISYDRCHQRCAARIGMEISLVDDHRLKVVDVDVHPCLKTPVAKLNDHEFRQESRGSGELHVSHTIQPDDRIRAIQAEDAIGFRGAATIERAGLGREYVLDGEVCDTMSASDMNKELADAMSLTNPKEVSLSISRNITNVLKPADGLGAVSAPQLPQRPSTCPGAFEHADRNDALPSRPSSGKLPFHKQRLAVELASSSHRHRVEAENCLQPLRPVSRPSSRRRQLPSESGRGRSFSQPSSRSGRECVKEDNSLQPPSQGGNQSRATTRVDGDKAADSSSQASSRPSSAGESGLSAHSRGRCRFYTTDKDEMLAELSLALGEFRDEVSGMSRRDVDNYSNQAEEFHSVSSRCSTPPGANRNIVENSSSQSHSSTPTRRDREAADRIFGSSRCSTRSSSKASAGETGRGGTSSEMKSQSVLPQVGSRPSSRSSELTTIKSRSTANLRSYELANVSRNHSRSSSRSSVASLSLAGRSHNAVKLDSKSAVGTAGYPLAMNRALGFLDENVVLHGPHSRLSSK